MNQNTIPMSICNTNKKIHILICVSGSVAAMKIPELVVKLYNHAYIILSNRVFSIQYQYQYQY